MSRVQTSGMDANGNLAAKQYVAPEGVDEGAEAGASPKADKEELLLKGLQALSQQSQANTQLTTLLADPEIKAILEARRAGKKLKIAEATEEGEEEEQPQQRQQAATPAQIDYETMTNAQLAEHIGKQQSEAFGGALKSILGKAMKDMEMRFEQKFGEPINKLASLEEGRQQSKMKDAITSAKDKFPDFGDFINDIKTINKQVQGLSVDEMYYLAKQRRGVPMVSTSSERPSHLPGDRQRSGRYATMKSGNTGQDFDALLDASSNDSIHGDLD